MTIKQRLEHARELRGFSLRKFQQEIEKLARQDKSVPATSYPAIHRYLKDKKTQPPSDFVAAAARILRVRPEWLLLGEGPRTVEEFTQQEAQRLGEVVREGIDAAAHPDQHFIATMDELGPRLSPQRWRRLQAVERFAQKLFDAGPSAERWAMQRDRHELLRAAGRFLIGVEDAFDRAGHGDHTLLLLSSASPGWYVAWSDAVLDLFARRVYGLGERDQSNPWDAHEAPDARIAHEHLRAEMLAETEASATRVDRASTTRRAPSRERRSRGR
jgi:hypothetical protein